MSTMQTARLRDRRLAGESVDGRAASLNKVVCFGVASCGCWVSRLLYHLTKHGEDVCGPNRSNIGACRGHVEAAQ
jgi:hypothetical protein